MDGGSELIFATLIDDEEVNYDETRAPLHHLARPKGKTYSDDVVFEIQLIYIIAAVFWILLIFACSLFQSGFIGWIFLTIPLIVYGIGFTSVCNHTTDVEDDMFLGNFLSFGFLVTVILINWVKVADKKKYFKLLMIALVFIMLSLIDVWVKKKYQIIVKHVRTILQTAALSLLAYVLYLYYSELIMQECFDEEKERLKLKVEELKK